MASFAYGRRGDRHSYYVSASKPNLGRKTITRVSAPPFEKLILDRARKLLDRHIEWSELKALIQRVEVHDETIQITFGPSAIHGVDTHAVDRLRCRLVGSDDLIQEDRVLRLCIAVRAVFRGGRTWMVKPRGAQTPAVTSADPALIKALAQAHVGVAEHGASPTRPNEWEKARAIPDNYLRRLAGVAFLGADIQRAILEGRQPAGLTALQLIRTGVPLAWADQRARFGFEE